VVVEMLGGVLNDFGQGHRVSEVGIPAREKCISSCSLVQRLPLEGRLRSASAASFRS
jgi:hypothetical protein